MKLALIIAFYAAIVFWGIRTLLAKGHAKEMILYALLVGWCAYLSFGKLYGWPLLTIASPLESVFQPVGKWIEQWMGGPPSE